MNILNENEHCFGVNERKRKRLKCGRVDVKFDTIRIYEKTNFPGDKFIRNFSLNGH